MPLAQLLQMLYDGQLPWATAVSSSSSTELDPRLGRIQLDMKMRAYDLRAVQQELKLLHFEMQSYGIGVKEQLSNLEKAIAQEQQCRAEQQQQQHALEEALQAAPLSQRYELHCKLKTADTAARHAQGRALLLLRQQAMVLRQQEGADRAFRKFTSSQNNQRAVAEAAAAAMATDSADADVDDSDSDDGLEEVAGMAGDAGATAADDAAAAADAAASGSSMPWHPSAGPDLVLVGPNLSPWANQVMLSGCATAVRPIYA